MDNKNIDRKSFDEQRRKKAENFHLNISEDAMGAPPAGDEKQVINSFSGQDVKEQIARESKKSQKKRERAQKRELKKRNKRNRRIFRIMWLVSILLVGAMVSAYVVTGMNDLLAINRTDDTVVSVKIPDKASLDTVTDLLVSSGVIKEGTYFKKFAELTKSDKFNQGTYELRKDMDYQAILSNLTGNSSRTDTVEVTIIEGMNVLEIADQLISDKALAAENKQEFLDLCSSDKFDEDFDFIKDIKNAANRYYKLEGYLYPDKYIFYQYDEPISIIYKFLNNFESKLYHKQVFDGYDKMYSIHKMISKTNSPYNLDQVLTIASIIQAEAANQGDAGRLAVGSVVMNRVASSKFPNTVSGVVYASGQFAPVTSGRVALILAEGPNSACQYAASQAIAGNTNTDALFFCTYTYAQSLHDSQVAAGQEGFLDRTEGTTINAHYFYNYK